MAGQKVAGKLGRVEKPDAERQPPRLILGRRGFTDDNPMQKHIFAD